MPHTGVVCPQFAMWSALVSTETDFWYEIPNHLILRQQCIGDYSKLSEALLENCRVSPSWIFTDYVIRLTKSSSPLAFMSFYTLLRLVRLQAPFTTKCPFIVCTLTCFSLFFSSPVLRGIYKALIFHWDKNINNHHKILSSGTIRSSLQEKNCRRVFFSSNCFWFCQAIDWPSFITQFWNFKMSWQDASNCAIEKYCSMSNQSIKRWRRSR